MSNQNNNDGPLFWYRPCSNGLYEGPLHDKTIEDVRKRSGAWVPLYPHPPAAAPAPAVPDQIAAWNQVREEARKLSATGLAPLLAAVEAYGFACQSAPAPSQEPVNGCDYCKHALYAGVKCPNCGAVSAPPQPSKYGSPELQALIVAHATQEPVTLTEREIGDCIDKTNRESQYGHHHFGWSKDLAANIIAALREKGALR